MEGHLFQKQAGFWLKKRKSVELKSHSGLGTYSPDTFFSLSLFSLSKADTLVHGEQSVEIFRPIPIVSTPGWKLKKRVIGVKDTKTGLILESEQTLCS